MPRKKKRSAKQLANDKRLGRMAKKRAAAARKVNPKRKRKVAKRKKRRNPSALRTAQRKIQRSTNPKRSKYYVIATIAGNGLKFHNGVSFKGTRSGAALFPMTVAKQIAGRSGRKSVIAPSTSTPNQIKTFLTGKR